MWRDRNDLIPDSMCTLCGGRWRSAGSGYLKYTYNVFFDGSIKREKIEPSSRPGRGCLGLIIWLSIMIMILVK